MFYHTLVLKAILLIVRRWGKSVRNLSFEYASIQLGIYIQGVSGKLYTEDEWSNQETANGVAVLTEICSFVILADSLEYMQDEMYFSSDDAEWPSVLGKVNNQENALLDFNGEYNTDVLETYGGFDVIDYARSIETRMGTKGYIPALGELNTYLENEEKILELLNLIK